MNLFARLALAAAAGVTFGAVAMAQDPVQQPAEPAVNRLQAAGGAKLRALDKITGNWTDISAKVGQTITHGRIKVTVRACFQSSPQDAPEAAAFLEINTFAKEGQEVKATSTVQQSRGPQTIGPDGLLFSGWMYASSPGLNALEHPTYDVWVISCSTSNPS
jgi:hypothetical protein